jgi:hypothetical protein
MHVIRLLKREIERERARHQGLMQAEFAFTEHTEATSRTSTAVVGKDERFQFPFAYCTAIMKKRLPVGRKQSPKAFGQ